MAPKKVLYVHIAYKPAVTQRSPYNGMQKNIWHVSDAMEVVKCGSWTHAPRVVIKTAVRYYARASDRKKMRAVQWGRRFRTYYMFPYLGMSFRLFRVTLKTWKRTFSIHCWVWTKANPTTLTNPRKRSLEVRDRNIERLKVWDRRRGKPEKK